MTNTILKKTFAVAVLAAAAALVATPAQAQPATQPRAVEVTANADGLVAPGVATLRPGVALDTFLDNMTTVLFSNDEEAKRLAGAQVARDMTRHGGVAVNARAAQAVTVLLPPGTYFLIDYTSLGRPNPSGHWHRITVSGEWSAGLPAPDQLLVMYEREQGKPRFRASSPIAPRSTQLVVNTTARGRVGCDERRVPLVECEESVVHRTTGCGAGPTRAMLTCGRDIMSYVHDIGGLHGFGPVPGRDDEVNFHAAWEARIFAILRSLIHNKVFTWDEFRHAIERMDTGAYFATSYYERWADAAERICVEKGVLSEDERGAVLAAMRAEPT